MAKFRMNPKVLQCIMGHGDISVTLDTYTHIKSEDAIAEMEKLDLLMEKRLKKQEFWLEEGNF